MDQLNQDALTANDVMRALGDYTHAHVEMRNLEDQFTMSEMQMQQGEGEDQGQRQGEDHDELMTQHQMRQTLDPQLHLPQDVDVDVDNTTQSQTLTGRKGKKSKAPPRSSTTRKNLTDSNPSEDPQPSRLPTDLPITAAFHPGPQNNLSNREQLAVLREAYTKNPTPGKAEMIQLSQMTGRPWGKIREYFRQRRNKLRGVDELEDLAEPERAANWLSITYRSSSKPISSIPQLEIYQSYRHRFDAFHKTTPLLGGSELISLACASFPGCSMARDEYQSSTGEDGTGGVEWLLKGIRKRDVMNADMEGGGGGDEDEGEIEREGTLSEGLNHGGEASAPRNATNRQEMDEATARVMEDLVAGMPEPLRAGTWLLQDYQDHNPLSPASDQEAVDQSDLYAQYASRFGEIVQHNDPSQQEAARGEGGAEPSGTSGAVEGGEASEHGDTDADQQTSNAGKSRLILEYRSTKPARLLTPVELIQLVKMTFKHADAKIDEQGNFVVTGLEKRLGLKQTRWKTTDGEKDKMFPFGLLDVPTSSPSHPFTSTIKRKLDVLESAEQVAAAKRIAIGPRPTPADDQPNQPVPTDDSAVFDMILAASHSHEQADQIYGEQLSEPDRELVEGLKRFKNSRLGKEVRDTCVSQ